MKYPFPGLTKAQRKALDRVALGDTTLAGVRPELIGALLERGLVACCGEKVICRDRFGVVKVPVYEMPTPAHIAWCEWQSHVAQKAGR